MNSVVDRELDEESRFFIKHIGYNIPRRIGKKGMNTTSTKINKFYADVPFAPPLTPIVDDDPIPPVDGEVYPLGFYMMTTTLRVLGHFPAKHCIKIWKTCEVISLKEGELACDFGDVDESLIVVVSGSLVISIQDDDFGHVQVNTIKAGEHVMSIFAILNYVIGGQLEAKPVSAVANKDSVVVKISKESIKRYYWDDAPHDLIPFARRMLTKIRGLYFEGLTEVAGLNKEILVPSMCQSTYEPFDDSRGCPGNVSKMMEEARREISKFVKLEDEDMPFCKMGSVMGGSTLSQVGVRQNSLIYIYRGELALFNYSTMECRVTTIEKEIDEETKKKFTKFQNDFTPIFFHKQGTTLGAWSLITNSSNFYSAMVPKGQKAIIFEIPGAIVKRRWNRDPLTMLPMIRNMLKRWSSLAKKIDYSIQV